MLLPDPHLQGAWTPQAEMLVQYLLLMPRKLEWELLHADGNLPRMGLDVTQPHVTDSHLFNQDIATPLNLSAQTHPRRHTPSLPGPNAAPVSVGVLSSGEP
ncbi:nexilin [Platysternon megacephalum]|uniref:Nexilin n=1 Tax=Platysternon megacephalum TaxID=55544 RepID=A0A4D9EX15_9SAUR|nr:nexilin [Platysternon megacephalum]